MLMNLVPIFFKLNVTHRYILHSNYYIKSSVMYATSLQNKKFSVKGVNHRPSWGASVLMYSTL